MTDEIYSITAVVPYSENNEKLTGVIPFRVYQREGSYIAIPFVSDAEREKMKLSEQLIFAVVNNRIVTENRQNHEVICNIASELQMLQRM